MAPYLIVILGAAVRPDGKASPALLRRIAGGRALALAHPEAPVVCSGAVGRFGPSEASIMAEVLTAGGVAADRLVLDEESRDTLQTGLAAARYVRTHGLAGAIVCTDTCNVDCRTAESCTLRCAGDAGDREVTGTAVTCD